MVVVGPLAGIKPGDDELFVELANRYVPPDRVDIFHDFTRSERGSQVSTWPAQRKRQPRCVR